MKKQDYLAVIIIVVGVFSIGLIAFSSNGLSASPTSPDISICKFEKMNQEITFYNQNDNSEGGFVVPLDIVYSEVIFTGFGVITEDEQQPESMFNLNGIDCGRIPFGRGIKLVDFSDSCTEVLQEGINNFSHTYPLEDTYDLLVLNRSLEIDHIVDSIGAEHLDGDRNFISDITNDIITLDGSWSEVIPVDHYVRVHLIGSPIGNLSTNVSIDLYPRLLSGEGQGGIEAFEPYGDYKVAWPKIPLMDNIYNNITIFNFPGPDGATIVREVLVEMKIKTC
ncbi:hypothetical protein AUJ84_03910 [Candidatus Pacearchaeota archaeon CG1_02_32_132]|nr:MAG: hypothetical protein AUJ84_03910 [Candidatus Pacearchaeota archaeon CG1_02_32_132]